MTIKLNYIAAVLDEKIIIKCVNKDASIFLRSIGAKRKILSQNRWQLIYKTDSDLAKNFDLLRNKGFLFSYDHHGWGPSSIFQSLRERKLLNGKFTEIAWRAPKKIETREL